ncbi:MAG: cation:proton antiporter [Geitlerinemataceae cyanobacterium]
MLSFFPSVLPTEFLLASEAVAESATIEDGLERFLLVLAVSLSVATLSRTVGVLRDIPYTLLLTIVGTFLAFENVRLVDLSPELILEIFLPPLLFEAGWNLRWKDLKRDWLPVATFAVVGVVVSVVGIALVLQRFAEIPLPVSLLIGASLAATDPVSTIALFRELGVEKRLTTLMEGESLFNDGVAVVAFGLLVGIATGVEQFSPQQTVADFAVFVGVGVGMGSAIGFGISYLTQRFDLPLVEQSLTLVSAYGTYVIAENLGGSGAIGVVTTGLILGNFGSRIGMNPRTRLVVTEFWEFIAFFTNSIVFLLIGDSIRFDSLLSHGRSIGVAIVAVVVTRAIVIYGLGAASNAIAEQPIVLSQKTVLWWGGLRGSVSIALALSIPTILEQRDEAIDIVFGVVLFTLLVQGLSIKSLLQKLALLDEGSRKAEYSEAIARRRALQKAADRLASIDAPEVDAEFLRYKREQVRGEIASLNILIAKICKEDPDVAEYASQRITDELCAIEAETYAELVRTGQLNEDLAPLLQGGE